MFKNLILKQLFSTLFQLLKGKKKWLVITSAGVLLGLAAAGITPAEDIANQLLTSVCP